MLQPVFFYCTAIINEHGGVQDTAEGLIISDRGRWRGKEKNHGNHNKDIHKLSFLKSYIGREMI